MTAPSPIGATLAGKYEVRRLIGRGGMGSVYEGLHVEIGKRVAIKLLETEHSKADEIAERFRREGRAASRVESEHVVQVFDVGQDETHGLYMVMEFLDGEDLSTRLEREKLVDTPLAIDIAWQAARGLAKAHTAGVIHRDLKPGNVFLAARDDGGATVKIVDFGISKLISVEEQKGTITRHGAAVGTPQYMSPEQAQGFAIDQRTDVWALGCVLYEMLAGKQAYELLENYEQTIFAIVLRKPPPLSAVAPWVPEEIAAIVDRALEHDLERRIPDCGTFARLLADAAKTLDLGGRVGAGNAPLALLRRAPSGSSPRVSLDELKRGVVFIPADASSHTDRARAVAASAETAPAIPAVDSVPRIATTAQPPTVTGVAVKTGHHPSFTPDSLPDSLEGPQKRSGKGVIAAVLLLGGLSAAAAFVMVRGNPLPSTSGTSGAASALSAPGPAPLPNLEPHAVAPSVSVDAKAVNAAPSTSSATSASARPASKPHPAAKMAAPSNSSASSKPQPGTHVGGGDDQFGGIGVANSY